MSSGLRGKSAIMGMGVMNNAYGTVPTGTTLVLEIPPLPGMDRIVATRIDFGGVGGVGTVTYELTNGQHLDAGYANNGGTDTLIPSPGNGRSIILNVSNNSGATISYNVLCLHFLQRDYECFAQEQLMV